MHDVGRHETRDIAHGCWLLRMKDVGTQETRADCLRRPIKYVKIKSLASNGLLGTGACTRALAVSTLVLVYTHMR